MENPKDGTPASENSKILVGRPDAGTEEYFRIIRRRTQIGLLLALLAPVALLSLYFHFQFNLAMRNVGQMQLKILAESQRNTIDLFLEERVANIFTLFHSGGFKLSPTPDDSRRYLQNLRVMSDAFVDVGFLNSEGIQIGYAGPYPYLQGKNYSQEAWFKSLIAGSKNYLITDIYLGFRNKPHFTIAVKQMFEDNLYIMRATLDPDKFYLFLRTLVKGESVDSSIINRDGLYQIVDPDEGDLLGKSNFIPPQEAGSGSIEINTTVGRALVAYAWLREATWSLIVKQPLQVAYAKLYRLRKEVIAMTSFLVVLLIGATWFTTERFLKRAQATEESRKELQSQLFHVAKLASVGELAAGVAHEINNPLAIIGAESGLIRDMLDPSFKMDATPQQITNELDAIDSAVVRARDVTQKLLSFVRKTEPTLVQCDINNILNEVVEGLMEKEFEVSNIALERNFATNFPQALLDPNQVYQVLLNIISNAGDAIDIKKGGKITLATNYDDKEVWATITDTGKGLTSEQMVRIFQPFYTTKDPGKGTGLGLSISLSIVEALGGRIEVQSIPDVGSSFTVVFPINILKTKTEKHGDVKKV